jgi:ferric-dicitrate binding protein FerR (iron transport regulator)
METENSGEIAALLREVRDLQKEHLDEYRRVAQRSLEIQQEAFERQKAALETQRLAVARQESFGRLYRGVVAAGAVIVVALIGLVVMLLVNIAGRMR